VKNLFLFISLSFFPFFLIAQDSPYPYIQSPEHPFGLPDPEAPPQLLDWDELIGMSECKSITRIDQNTWGDTVQMIWVFKYIMNGTAVQDETLKEDGKNAGSIRQFNADSARWYVHYYNSGFANPVLSTWEGNRNISGDIILYREQKSPNGLDGFYKITFSEISKDGFNWLGEWVNEDESILYPTWKIYCRKKK